MFIESYRHRKKMHFISVGRRNKNRKCKCQVWKKQNIRKK